jgi:hypothetical protein
MPGCQLHVPALTWQIRLVGVAAGCVGGPDLALGEDCWDSRWPQGVLPNGCSAERGCQGEGCPASPPCNGHFTGGNGWRCHRPTVDDIGRGSWLWEPGGHGAQMGILARCFGLQIGVGHWPEHLHVVPGGDGIQQLRCGIFGRFGRLPAVHRARPRARSDDRPQGTRCVTMRNAADQCALLVPMDTTTMSGATDDQSHRHKV